MRGKEPRPLQLRLALRAAVGWGPRGGGRGVGAVGCGPSISLGRAGVRDLLPAVGGRAARRGVYAPCPAAALPPGPEARGAFPAPPPAPLFPQQGSGSGHGSGERNLQRAGEGRCVVLAPRSPWRELRCGQHV